MRVEIIEIDWNPSLPVFAKREFLSRIADEYGWFGGFDSSNDLLCVLPFTIIKKGPFRLARFRVQTIPVGPLLTIADEQAFLSAVMSKLESHGAHVVVPSTTNAVFRTYPENADAAPYGTYVIDLHRTEDALWQSINRKLRQDINKAKKRGVVIRRLEQPEDQVHTQIADTFARSGMPFMDRREFDQYIAGLGENGRILSAEVDGVAQSYVVFAHSDYCAYAVYAGNLPRQVPGSNKLLYWEAILAFRNMGVRRFDFVGGRINPQKGSKQDGINSLKRRFGAELICGYIWRYPLRKMPYMLYRVAVKLQRGGDIVDLERSKMPDFQACLYVGQDESGSKP